MRKTILTVFGAALIAVSAMQVASAAEHHRTHKADRAPVSTTEQFRNSNAAWPACNRSGQDGLQRYGYDEALSAPCRPLNLGFAATAVKLAAGFFGFCGRPVALEKGLPNRNECCRPATLSEHLADNPAGPRLRRYLATPLHEIIPS